MLWARAVVAVEWHGKDGDGWRVTPATKWVKAWNCLPGFEGPAFLDDHGETPEGSRDLAAERAGEGGHVHHQAGSSVPETDGGSRDSGKVQYPAREMRKRHVDVISAQGSSNTVVRAPPGGSQLPSMVTPNRSRIGPMGLTSVATWLPAKSSPTGRPSLSRDPAVTTREPESPPRLKFVPETTS